MSQIKKIVYHGSNNLFNQFDKKFLNSNAGMGDDPISDLGFFFADTIEAAKAFGKIIYMCEIYYDKPKIHDFKCDYYSKGIWDRRKKYKNNLLGVKRTHDSLIINNCKDGHFDLLDEELILSNQFCVFNTNQIKIIKIIYN